MSAPPPPGGARAALRAMRDGVALLAALPPLPVRPASRLLAERLRATHVARAAPQTAWLDGLRARLVAACAEGGTPARRDLQDAPWILWQGTPAGAAVPGLLDAVCAQAATSSRTARNLIDAWLRDFAPDAPRIAEAGHAIAALLDGHDDQRLAAWRRAQRRFDLFDAARGPEKLARALIDGAEPVEAILAACGLDDPLRGAGGFMRACAALLLPELPEVLRRGAAERPLQRCLRVLAPDGRPRFGGAALGALARALLAAWLDRGPAPPPALRDAVRRFLLGQLGDPRLRPAAWTAVGAPETALVRGWLAGATVQAFFRLLGTLGHDAQWRWREAFWAACLAHEAIDDAWIVVGPEITPPRELGEAFGALDAGPGGGAQAALLLRAGPLVFCEWSHNGKLRAWAAESRNAPRLQQPHYARAGLQAKGLPFPPNAKYGTHGASDGLGLSQIHSDRDYWQGSVAALLEARLGLALQATDWRGEKPAAG